MCNCNDPIHSSFTRYFLRNFHRLKLQQLICTSYADFEDSGGYDPHTLFDDDPFAAPGKGYVIRVINAPTGIEGYTDQQLGDFIKKSCCVKMLNGTGDFASDECLKFLKESDIVCTNPPFSLFRTYIATLVDSGKEFLVMGNMNECTTNKIFVFFMENKMWFGHNHVTLPFARGDGVLQKFRYIYWYTNLPVKRDNAFMQLKESYNAQKYPKYDTYDAINVDRLKDIPKDYDGIMGVPITFLLKYDKAQFDVLGKFQHNCKRAYNLAVPVVNGKVLYDRIAIKRK